jgi:hypothetical protein
MGSGGQNKLRGVQIRRRGVVLADVPVREGPSEAVPAPLPAGTAVDPSPPESAEPLHRACAQGDAALTAALLRDGQQVRFANSLDADGHTPLHLAAMAGVPGVAVALLEVGANPNAPDRRHGRTPLHTAALYRAGEVLEVLLDAGAALDAADDAGERALHLAARHGHVDILGQLLARDAHVEAVSRAGTTALHPAAAGGHEAALDVLLSAGADPNATLGDGRTALDLAPNKRIARRLVSAGGQAGTPRPWDGPSPWLRPEREGLFDFMERPVRSLRARVEDDCVYAMSLADKGFQEVPPEVTGCPNLRQLVLARNALTALPEAFLRLRLLVHVDLSDNQLTTLPDGLQDLTALRELYLQGNPIPRGERARIRALLPRCRVLF